MKYKIFEASNKQEAINALLKEGYHVATLKQVAKLRETGNIPDYWYDLNLVYFWKTGELREATIKELRDLKKNVYDKDGRVLFVRLRGSLGDLDGVRHLSSDARFVGMKT